MQFQIIYVNVIIIGNDNELRKGSFLVKLHYGLNELKDIDWFAVLQIALPFMLVGFILILIALVDLYKHRKERANVLLWTIVILFFNTIGPILYFTIGRKGAKIL